MKKEELYQKIKEYFDIDEGFIKHNNLHLESIDDCYAKMSVNLTKESLNPNGTVHGGLIFGLADTVMGTALRTTGRNICTINSQIDYLKPGKGKRLIAETEKVKVGKTTAVMRCSIYDEKDNLISTATGTYFFLD